VMTTGSFDDVLARCSSSIKRAVVRARNAGVRSMVCDDLDEFLPLLEKTFEKQGMSVPFRLDGVAEVFRVARERGAAKLYMTRDAEGQTLSGLIQLTSGAHANTWLLASDPERLREGVATCTQLHSFSKNDELETIDDASANIENLHHNAVRLGGVLHPVFVTRFCRSTLLDVRSAVRRLSRTARRSWRKRRAPMNAG
jgi:hypothetical protein